jgi:hypothetical protein
MFILDPGYRIPDLAHKFPKTEKRSNKLKPTHTEIEVFLTQKLKALISIDLGSEIRDPERTHPISRIQGSKRHRIPDRIHNPDMMHLLSLKVQGKSSFEDFRYLEAGVHVCGEEGLEVSGEVGEAALQRTEGGVPGRGTLVQRWQQQLTPLSITDQALRTFYLLARLAKENSESRSAGISSLQPVQHHGSSLKLFRNRTIITSNNCHESRLFPSPQSPH